jgi:alpha-methylacyl-CoA racemase
MGPLEGIRIVEFAGIGPGPFCAMMLADMGAEVLRIDRAQNVLAEMPPKPSLDLLNRGRRSVAVDLKHPEGIELVMRLLGRSDALLEGFRPGVMERLGLGPDACLGRNPRLVYGRMTGWGQEGPLAHAAGHDINYIAVAGALDPIGRRGGAPPPTWWATSEAAACCWPSAWCARWSSAIARAGGRWWTPPWWTAPQP